MTIFETVAMSRKSEITDQASSIRTCSVRIRCSFAAPYQELLHSGGRTAFTMSGPIIPETGLPMISGGQGLGFEEAEILSKVDKKERSRGRWRVSEK